MRHTLMVTLVAALALLPIAARAENTNQESANRIAAQLKQSGQLTDYKVGVRYLDGTVWLQGFVRDQEQLRKVETLVFSTPDVTINQVIKDDLRVGEAADTAQTATRTAATTDPNNPLRKSGKTTREVGQAQPLPSSFTSRGAMPVAMVQPIPAPPNSSAKPVPLPATNEQAAGVPGAPLPMHAPNAATYGQAPMRYDQPCLPNYAWPSYSPYPNYAAVTYPKQYSATAWPYIGPFYPYPQVPLGWRKVSLEWDDGWWWLDFKDKPRACWWR